jgi:hypothetical protein
MRERRPGQEALMSANPPDGHDPSLAGSNERSRHLQAAAYFALLTLLFFAPVWLTGRAYLATDFLYRTPLWYDPRVALQNFDLFDTALFFTPDYEYLNRSLRQGEFPFWNPYNLGGRPVAFNGQSGYFYPPRLMAHSLLSTVAACSTLLVIHLFLSGQAMYWLARSVGQSHLGSLFSGTAWMLSGWSTTWFTMEHAPIFAALLPLGVLALRRALREWRGTAYLSLLVGLTLVAGHLQFTYYCWAAMLLLGAYFLYQQPARARPGAAIRVSSGFVLGVLLAAPMLVPTAINMTASQRPTLSLDWLQTTYRQALWSGLPTFLVPDAYGNPADNFALLRVSSGGYFIYPELCWYIGVPSVLLFFCCLGLRGLPRYLGILAFLCLVVPATPLYGLLYELPGLDRINSTRMMFLWVVFASLGSGFGLDALQQQKRRWLIRGAGAALLGWLATLATLNGGAPVLTARAWLEQGKVRLPEAALYLSKEEHLAAVMRGFEATYGWTSWTALAPLLWLGLFCLALSLQRGARVALLVILVADLLSFGVRFNSKMPVSSLYPETATIRFLREHTQWERVMGVGTIRPNTLMPFQLFDSGGYDAFYPYYSGRFFSFLMAGEAGLTGSMPPQAFPLKNTASPLVDLLGVKYFIAYPGQTVPGCRLVQEAPLPVFENPERLPRAFLVRDYETVPDLSETLRRLASEDFDPRRTVLLAEEPGTARGSGAGQVEIVSYRPHEVRLQVETDSQPGLLVLTDAFAPGWSAQADGQDRPIYRADGMFRAVPLQGGEREVVFRYRPARWNESLALLGLALLLTLILLAIPGRPGKL